MDKIFLAYIDFHKCLDSLNKASDVNMQPIEQCIDTYLASIASYENFVIKLSAYRYTYPDIVEPLLSNIMELLYGMKLNLDNIKSAISRYNLRSDVQNKLIGLIKFPTVSSMQNGYENHISLCQLISRSMDIKVEGDLVNPGMSRYMFMKLHSYVPRIL